MALKGEGEKRVAETKRAPGWARVGGTGTSHTSVRSIPSDRPQGQDEMGGQDVPFTGLKIVVSWVSVLGRCVCSSKKHSIAVFTASCTRSPVKNPPVVQMQSGDVCLVFCGP